MFLQILLASVVGGVLSLGGGVVLLWKEELARRFSLTLVSFAAGALVAAAFLDLLPEALQAVELEQAGIVVIAGILLIFVFEKLLKWYHCHDQEVCDYHTFSSTVLVGDALHNFIDGVIIALSFGAGTPVGIAATIAVFLHEIPQEIGDFGVLLHAGYTKRKVLFFNFLTALTTIAGAIIGFFLLSSVEPYLPLFLAFAAGIFIYIAVSDLLPELRHQTQGGDVGHLASLILGVLIVWALGTWLPE